MLILLLGVIAGITLAGVIILSGMQVEFARRDVVGERALAVAEAGLNYYGWHLLHDASDFTSDTGEHTYADPGGGAVGAYEIEVTPPSEGSTIITVKSTGWLNENPGIKRAVVATYGVPSLARFAFLHNSNVWFGHGMTINGPVMTNGGIRQDGVNTSTLSTIKSTYTCGVETGCETPEEKPGIWGNGGPTELWQFPVTGVDFENINVDFDFMKTAAVNDGLYLGPSGAQGYHLVFQADGSVKVYRVNTTDFYKGWSFDYLCENLYQTILTENLVATHQVADNPIIFAEDNLWAEGTVNGKTTVVAARFPIDSYNMDIWIPDNLVYLDRSGVHSLGLIAQRDIAFAKDVPDDFEVDGALLAQSSRILRHHYNYHGCKQGNPAMKNSLTIYGAVISNLISYWNFSGGGSEQPTSGFVKREIIYDPNLYFTPPPYFPSSGELELISWNEVKAE